MNEDDFSVFCINLARRIDRLKQFLSCFPDFWMNKLKIVNAIDGYTHTLSHAEKWNLRNADWNILKSRGQWGCSFSHEIVWRNIVKENMEYSIVLEDDAKLISEKRINDLEYLIQTIKKQKIHICFLGPNNHPENTKFTPHDFTDLVFPGICRIKSNLGSMAYIISKNGATELLNIIEKKGHYRAVDQIINDYMKQNGSWFCSSPPFFSINDGLGSDIIHVS